MHNDTNLKTSVRLEHSVLAVEQEHELHAMVELSVPHLADEIERPPLRVALVLDRSGSMAGPKLAAARRCARWLAGRLRPADELALDRAFARSIGPAASVWSVPEAGHTEALDTDPSGYARRMARFLGENLR